MKLTISQIVFLGVILALATLSWYWLYQILYFNQTGWAPLSRATFLFTFLISLLFILWLSSQYFLEIFLSVIFALASFFFIFPFQKNIFIGVAAAFIFLIWAAKKIISARNQQLKISIKSILKNGIFWSLIAFFMVISLAFHSSPKNSLEINLPLQYFNYLEPILQKNIPSYRPDLAKNQIDFLKNNINFWIGALPLKWQNYLKIALSSSLFLSLWALTYLFSPIIIFFSWLIFKLLLWTKLMEIKTESVEKEIITTK